MVCSSTGEGKSHAKREAATTLGKQRLPGRRNALRGPVQEGVAEDIA